MNNSLLPPNASQLERDLETVIAHSLDLPVSIKSLWDPWTCPASLLPWLAWANSVDDWNEHWPEQIKRQVIDAAFDVHRYKGTPHAVQRALDSLGINTSIKEWWEPGGSAQPGTMTVTALLNDNIAGSGEGLINADMLRLVTRAVNSAKRGSIHFDVELGIALAETLALAAAPAPGVGISSTDPEALPVLPDGLAGELAATLAEHRLHCADHDLVGCSPLPDELTARPALAAGAHHLTLSDLDFMGVA